MELFPGHISKPPIKAQRPETLSRAIGALKFYPQKKRTKAYQKNYTRPLRGCRGATLPALPRSKPRLSGARFTSRPFNQNPAPRTAQSSRRGAEALPSKETYKSAAKEPHPPLEGVQESDAPRSPTGKAATQRRMLHEPSFNQNPAPRTAQSSRRGAETLPSKETYKSAAKEPHPPLEGVQGSDAPRPPTGKAAVQLSTSRNSTNSEILLDRRSNSNQIPAPRTAQNEPPRR